MDFINNPDKYIISLRRIIEKRRARRRRYQKKYRKFPGAKIHTQAWRKKHPGYIKDWLIIHPGYISIWRSKNRIRYNLKQRAWRKLNRDKRRYWMRYYMKDYRRGLKRRK